VVSFRRLRWLGTANWRRKPQGAEVRPAPSAAALSAGTSLRARYGRGGMKGKKEVIDILNDALKHELGAVNQYWLHYRMLDNWGYTKLAKKERKESIEEMQHADKLVDRIIFLEGLPNMQHIAPLMIGQDIKEVLECDLRGEFNARDLYTRAREICRRNEDLVSMALFEELLADEEGHIDFLETQLDLLAKIGVQNYGQLQADAADEAEGDD
jgi:bacterioferritin